MVTALVRPSQAPPAAIRPATGTLPARSADPAARRDFRADIEGLRAIAVVSVVLYHFGLLHVSGGYVGVDVFFVISGFLITRQLTTTIGATGIRALPRFYAARFRRLLPAAAVLIIATFIAIKLWVPLIDQPQMLRDGALSAVYGMNYTLAVRGTQYLHIGDAASPFQHFWSLGVEEQFYLLWPAVIVLVFGIARRGRMVVLGAVAAVGAAVSLYLCLGLTRTANPWAYFSLWTRWWELALGAVIAMAAGRLRRLPRWSAWTFALVGLAGIVFTCFAYSDATVYPGSAAIVPVVASGLVILAGCIRSDTRLVAVLGCAPMRFLGRVSYSWYLWHWPIVVLAPYVIGRPTTLQTWGLVALSLLCATQSYWIVESGTRAGRLRWPRWLSLGTVAALVVAASGWSLADSVPRIVGTGQAADITSIHAHGGDAVGRAESVVANGLLTATAPSNLQPSVDRAANDVPRANYNGCHADYTVVKQGACVYGDPNGKHTAVLFGDSHMEQWLPGFDAAGKQAKWKVVSWTKAGCPFGEVNVYNASLNTTYTNCTTWRTETLRRMVALHPDRIFLGSYEDIADGQFSNAAWVAGAERTVAWLRAHTKAQILYVADSPKPTTLIPQCVSQNLSSVERCTFSAARAVINPARHAALAAGMRSAGAEVVDPQPWLCPAGQCPVIVGQYLVYRDDNHLTATFAAWLAPVLRTLLPVRG